MRLAEAKRGGTLERLLADIQRAQLLVLDEWGYIPVDKEGSQLLFRVIAAATRVVAWSSRQI
jgi:DNA replication protein DnaC